MPVPRSTRAIALVAAAAAVGATASPSFAAAPAAAPAPAPGLSFKFPDTETTVGIGGYLKLDAVWSNPSAGVDSATDLFLSPGAIPVGPGAGANEHQQVKFGARETRLYVKTTTPTERVDLVTYVEGDLYGADGNESVSNSNGVRLRHAWGSLGPLLAGQTWTNFMYVAALPETVDFGGPVGQIFVRQAQVRWTHVVDASQGSGLRQWSVALENPETVLAQTDGSSFRADDDRWPDLTAQLQFGLGDARLALSALAREIRADAKAPAIVDQRWGGALSLAGVLPLGGGDDVRYLLSAGNAIGRYSDGFFPDAVSTDGVTLQLPRQQGWYAAYRHVWDARWRSNLVLSGADEHLPEGTAGSVNRSTKSLHVNLLYSPVRKVDFGTEIIVARRETVSGQTGTLHRVQASAKFAF